MYLKSQIGTQELNVGLPDSYLQGLGINKHKNILSKGEILHVVWTHTMMNLYISKWSIGFN